MTPAALVKFFRDQQRRAAEYLGLSLPRFSVWDPTLPDSRVRDPKKRGLIYHRKYGPVSRLYCVDCGKPSPIGSPESMLKVLYKCNSCVAKSGAPDGAVCIVPGTESF